MKGIYGIVKQTENQFVIWLTGLSGSGKTVLTAWLKF